MIIYQISINMIFMMIRNTIQNIKFANVCIIMIYNYIPFHPSGTRTRSHHKTKQTKTHKQRNQLAITIIQRGAINYA